MLLIKQMLQINISTIFFLLSQTQLLLTKKQENHTQTKKLLGKSVETMQNENSNVETQHNQSDKSTPPLIPPFYMGKFNTNFEFKMPKKSLEDENVTKEKLSNLESSLNHEHVNDGDFSSRPIKKAYRKLFDKSLSVHSIPSYASPPKREPILTIHQPIPCTDIPPIEKQLEEEGEEEDPFVIRRNIVDRLTFASTQDDNDDSMNEQRLASIFYDLERQYPNVTEWYQLKKLNLSRQNLAQIDDLASCFPYLEVLQISHNELRSISGLPSSLIYIYASHNRLSDVDIYHLDKLQYLDLSHNFINSFQDMSNLKSLRTLDASHNAITSCKTFQNLPGLVILSLRANCIRRLVNFESVIRNNQIESLDVSFNRIECLDSIEHLKHLRELNANHNDIKYIQLNQPMERLCKLQLSFNRLKSFDVSPFPDIRVLYLDDNQIQRIIGVACISRLDSFSLRDQGRQKVEYSLQYLRGARKLYLSGSPFQSMKQMVDFYSLEYLELCSAELEVLPPEFGKQVPNLATLNLSMNRLTDIRPLRKLKYLRKLVLIDNRLMSLNEVIAVVQYLKHLHYLDLRQNPMSANIYPPLNLTFIQSISDHERISPYVLATQDESWLLSDMEFLKDLSDHWKTRRQVYRALFIQKCSKLIELDQIKIEPQDRSEGDLVIGNFRKTQTPYPVSTTSGSLSHQS
ncbi:uncharacterized protein B0P05DRAFT_526641 [Gilbertella persicaria]|uniref:uncharacterized protein n=1 Tax=Gilbertella persicaria TaxID=101096 RepID=UPI00221E8D29|nr:uncharacterized protein B0P05DRAFT_526641 [Gilbertella persicaria]KAI8091230.1 hypothetical protein B0P05DRAFT_526641 [Gilbertella persicaria]